MLEIGAQVPLEARVWLGPNDPVTFGDVLESGPILLLFYLFDWTST